MTFNIHPSIYYLVTTALNIRYFNTFIQGVLVYGKFAKENFQQPLQLQHWLFIENRVSDCLRSEPVSSCEIKCFHKIIGLHRFTLASTWLFLNPTFWESTKSTNAHLQRTPPLLCRAERTAHAQPLEKPHASTSSALSSAKAERCAHRGLRSAETGTSSLR